MEHAGWSFVKRQIAFNAESRDRWDVFASHRERVMVLLGSGETLNRDRLCVLGAGNANDLDLAALLRTYREVHLVDLDAEALASGVARQAVADHPSLRIHGGIDLTGMRDDMASWSPRTHVRPEVLTDCVDRPAGLIGPALSGPFEVVASTCLLSQLIGVVVDAVGEEHPQLVELIQAIRAGHLRLLTHLVAPGGTAFLITDIVSSETVPTLASTPEGSLTTLLVRLVRDRNLFHGVNPAILSSLPLLDPVLKAQVSVQGSIPPWRWNFGPRLYLVWAFKLRKTGAKEDLTRSDDAVAEPAANSSRRRSSIERSEPRRSVIEDQPRLLFASCHGYVDPSSGAATATRDVLELLVARGVDCRVLATGVLDYRDETALEQVLGGLEVPVRRVRARLRGGGDVPVVDFGLGGVRVTLMPTASSRIERSPDPSESRVFLDLAEQVLDRFRPRTLLTYGGHPANLELLRRARRRGIATVFHLHNFSYDDRRAFDHASVVLVPTEYARRHYHERLGLACTAIDLPINPARVLASDRSPRYLTFVNPVPEKGLPVFARIAAELDHRRPEIPILLVEGRGTASGLAYAGLDLSRLRNLHRMASTTDPRDFYRVTRALLMPSLWRENAALAAREALANGIPVLASDRGALPEALGDAGFVLPVPDRCTTESGLVPTADEVAPWLAAVEALWDDPAFEADHRARAFARARRWDGELLVARYEDVFFDAIKLGSR